MSINVRDLRARRADLVQDMRAMNDTAELEDRDLNETEKRTYDDKLKTVNELESRIKRLESESHIKDVLETRTPPAINKTGRVDSEIAAFAHWARTGQKNAEIRASNATDMNITTDADGGYAVPTGHYQGIIAKRNENALFSKVGVMDIPGKGTTVNVTLDNEADGEFVVTDEAADGDLDAPALGTVAMTLVNYTKDVILSEQLLADEDSRLIPFLNEWVGRGMAKTENALLVAAVNAGGTSFKAFAAATAIAAGEVEDIVFNDTLSDYLDDSVNCQWVMKASTFGKIAQITGSDRQYAETPAGSFRRQLLGFPVNWSKKVEAMTASKKSVLFGNWSMVGRREDPGFTVLRNPYLYGRKRQVVFHYSFRVVYAVLQADAIGYGIQDDGV